MAQAVEHQTGGRQSIHFPGVELAVVATLILGVVHGGLGVLHEHVEAIAVVRIDVTPTLQVR